ncbi:MAG: hypothetical protein LUQ66_10780 [Methanoregula sp.]|nr:hypothetical protein [Methanoregula sp.]
MKKTREQSPDGTGRTYVSLSRNMVIRLLLIPVLVYLIWVLETFLFEGRGQLFLRPDPAGIILYTATTCILAGLVVPVFLMRRAFVAGDVTMFHLGFRSLHRTGLAVVLTVLIIGAAVALANPFGTDRSAFAMAFLLLLPTGIASVMICWVIAGTHIQALVRDGGVLPSISVGVVVTGILFGLTSRAQFPGAGTPDTLLWYISAGILVAIFFFAVRDVWAASVAVTGCLVYLAAGWLDATLLKQSTPVILLTALVTTGVLALVHWYLSRHYVTIPVPVA